MSGCCSPRVWLSTARYPYKYIRQFLEVKSLMQNKVFMRHFADYKSNKNTNGVPFVFLGNHTSISVNMGGLFCVARGSFHGFEHVLRLLGG